MIAPSILASSDSRCGVNSASSRNPPEQMFKHRGAVADDDERAHLRLQDAVDALPQRGTRGHEPQRGVENFRSALRQQILPVGTGSEATPRRTRPRPAPRADRRPAAASCPATSGVEHGHDRAPEPEPQRLGEPARRLRHLADLAAEADLADDDRVGVDRARRCARPRSRARPRGRRPARRPARRPRRSRRRPGRRARRRRAVAAPRRASTSRLPSNACATRRGIGAPVGATSDCTSTHSGRVPSITAVTTEPVAPTRRSARNSALGSLTGDEPARGHLHEPELVGRAEAVLQRAQHAQRVMAIALEREHRVDDVLERARPGEPTVLRDVPDEQGRDVVLLREPHELLRAVAHLGDRTRPRPARRDRARPGSSRSRARPARPSATYATTAGSDVSETTNSSGASAPSRSARIRTCAVDSSAHTSRQRAPRAAMLPERLHEQRALAHPRLAADERDRARDEAAAEHPVELGDLGGELRGAGRLDLGDRHRHAPQRDRRRRARRRGPRAAGSSTRRPSPTCRTRCSGRATWPTRSRRWRTRTAADEQTFGSWPDRSRGLRQRRGIRPVGAVGRLHQGGALRLRGPRSTRWAARRRLRRAPDARGEEEQAGEQRQRHADPELHDVIPVGPAARRPGHVCTLPGRGVVGTASRRSGRCTTTDTCSADLELHRELRLQAARGRRPPPRSRVASARRRGRCRPTASARRRRCSARRAS